MRGHDAIVLPIFKALFVTAHKPRYIPFLACQLVTRHKSCGRTRKDCLLEPKQHPQSDNCLACAALDLPIGDYSLT